MLLRHAKVSFVDRRVRLCDWPQVQQKFELRELPVLVYFGSKLAHSYAIMQFLGKRYGYMPNSPEEHYEVISAMNTFEDFFTSLDRVFGSAALDSDAEMLEMQNSFQQKDMPILLGYLEKRLQAKDNKDFIVGSALTIADFYILALYSQLLQMQNVLEIWDKLADIPLLKALIKKRFSALRPVPRPKLQLYTPEARPQGEMVRLLLQHAQIPFEDIKTRNEDAGGPNGLNSTDLYGYTMVLKYEGKQLCQADAIMHGLGLKLGYLPFELHKYTRVIEMCGVIKDISTGYLNTQSSSLSEGAKKTLLDEYFSKKVPLLFAAIEKRLLANNSKDFLVGRKYTMADFYMIATARTLFVQPLSMIAYQNALDAVPTLTNSLDTRLLDFSRHS